MGNPDIPTPEPVVEKLKEAVDNPRNHRYSASQGHPEAASGDLRPLRALVGRRARSRRPRRWRRSAPRRVSRTSLGLCCEPGDSVLVPEPTYPIHTYAMILSGANVTAVPLSIGLGLLHRPRGRVRTLEQPKPRVVLCSFPHNPTTAVVDLGFFEQLVDFAKTRDVMIVHDLAYADLVFDQERAPSLMQVPGAKDVGVEFFSMSKSYSMAGLAARLLRRQRRDRRRRSPSSSPISTTASSNRSRSRGSSP